MQAKNCEQVLQTLIESARAGSLPWVLLRPRDIDEATAFEGDFDFLIDESRFGDILASIFLTCQKAGISFVVRQRSAFKRQIELLDAASRCITLELWSHAEFRTGRGHSHLTRAALGYRAYGALPPNKRASQIGRASGRERVCQYG